MCWIFRTTGGNETCIVLDGVYRTAEGLPVFHAVRPRPRKSSRSCSRVSSRLMKFLMRKGYLIEEQGMTYL